MHDIPPGSHEDGAMHDRVHLSRRNLLMWSHVINAHACALVSNSSASLNTTWCAGGAYLLEEACVASHTALIASAWREKHAILISNLIIVMLDHVMIRA